MRVSFTHPTAGRIAALHPVPLRIRPERIPMLTVTGSRQAYCDGVHRRNFLKIGAFGASLTLADVLRARAAGGGQTPATSQKAAVMIYLPGGPSHIDTFDPKPAAPV